MAASKAHKRALAVRRLANIELRRRFVRPTLDLQTQVERAAAKAGIRQKQVARDLARIGE